MITGLRQARHAAAWQRELAEAFTDTASLLHHVGLDPAVIGSGSADHGFPVRVPRPFADRMRAGDAADPLLRQVLPLAAESLEVTGFGSDPVGDLASRVAPGVLHKYAGRVLLIATGACAVNCRYCFRRHFPYAPETAARDGWRAALDYIRGNADAREVILSGGDPLVLNTRRLRQLSDGLCSVAHVRRLRIHTRVPVALPGRIDTELLDWLSDLPMGRVIVIHCNHARELDESVGAALARLREAGARLFNQTVLLKGVNDTVAAQMQLAEALFETGVTPYYLHLLDRVQGAAHFEVDESRARVLYESMRRRLSGYLLPRLVREIAGRPYKVPLL